MELRDGPHQCQTKSGTAQLSGAGIIHPEKGLENPLAERFRDAGSLVGNHDLEPFPIPVARDVYNAAGRAVLDGIFHQIAYRLPEQLCISGQGTGRGICLLYTSPSPRDTR